MLSSRDDERMNGRLSIVVQGPFKERTDKLGHSTLAVLRSARRHYPEAELVYSGWEGFRIPPEVSEVADLVVLSPDPGPVRTFTTEAGDVLENINRQIVSTVAGLRRSSGRFTIKSRSDTLIVRNCLDDWRARQAAKANRTTMFQLPVVAASQFTRLFFFEYGGFRPCLGHLSDLFFFGLRDDLLRYWEGTPVQPNPMTLPDRQSAATAEQILSIRFLAGKGELPATLRIGSKFTRQIGQFDWLAWVKVLDDNFIVLPDTRLGVRHPSRFGRLGVSRFIFETDSSISASRGMLGHGRLAWFYLIKFVIYLEYQLKFVVRRLLGTSRYRSLTKYVISHTTLR